MTKICWEDPGEPLEIGISSCSSTRNADSIVNKNWIDRNSTALPELGNKISVVDEPQMGHNNQSIGTSQLPWLSRSLLLLPFDPFFAMFVLSLSSILRILEIYTANAGTTTQDDPTLKLWKTRNEKFNCWPHPPLCTCVQEFWRSVSCGSFFMLHDDVNIDLIHRQCEIWHLCHLWHLASKSSKLRFLWSLLLRQDFIIVIGTDVQCRMRPRSWRQCSHRWL